MLCRFLTLGGRRPRFEARPSAVFLVPLGVVAGVADAIGGGGWGPVGTTSLLSSGRLEPRKVIGSIDTSEFVVAVGASIGFFISLEPGSYRLSWVLALLVGGVVAAPAAAWLVRHLAARVLGVAAGGFIVLTNTLTLLDAWFGVSLEEGSTTLLIAWGVLALAWLGLVVWAVRAERASRREPDREPVGV